jgi:heme-degrading monooxygenase HmoA
MRRAAGEVSARMFRCPDQPQEVDLLCEWESLDRARKFFQAPALKSAMRQAGVLGRPDIEFMEEIHIVHRTSAD